MCGIVGFTGNKNTKLLSKILATIKHRGPDERVVYIDKFISVGMNRLSIIDLHKNLYPMRYKNFILFYNGEIYNFQKLRSVISIRQLAKKNLAKRKICGVESPRSFPASWRGQDDNIRFKTNSDAEVILPLFHKHGSKAFSMLEGMFAIFIYDKKNQIIYLARDKAGEKPLYFYHKDSQFAFASELKPLLLTINHQSLTINHRSLSSYLYQGHVLAPNTIINGIQKLPPAHYLKFDLLRNRLSLKLYWQPIVNVRKTDLTEESIIAKLDKLIQEAVKERLIADVPLGCFLSGGVDSSLITYWASKYKSNLKTFSIAFPGFEENYDEATYAQKIGKLLKTNHVEISCTAQKIRPVVENIGQIIDEPIIDAAVPPLYLLAERAAKDLKVVLSGEGADELFGGYERYQKELLIGQFRNLLKPIPFSFKLIKLLFPKRFRRLITPITKHYSSQKLWNQEMLKQSLGIHRAPELKPSFREIKNFDSLNYMQQLDLSGFLAEQLLMKVDKTTMFHSLETRTPYLDPQIIEFALNLPTVYKIRNFTGKYLLKKVAEKYLPKEIVWRKKHGFSVPLNYWFRNELKDIVYDSIKEVKKYSSLFDGKYYQYIIEQHLKEKKDYGDQIWGMIVLLKFLQYHKISN